jgi:GxxExxY protein
MDLNRLTGEIIGAAIEVYKTIGPGLLESAYSRCLQVELSLQKIPFQKELVLPIEYKGVSVEAGYRMDFLVDDCVIVELKSVERLLPIHHAQLLSYLRLSNKKLGLLINFNVPILKNGIKRLIND